MDITLETQKTKLIKPNTDKDGSRSIDNNSNLNIEVTKDGVLITPDEDSLAEPERKLEYEIEETGEKLLYFITIQKSQKQLNPLPMRLKIFESESNLIPQSENYISGVWSFKDDTLNSKISINQSGVSLNDIPAGFHTLSCELNNEIFTIEIQCVKKQSSSDNKIVELPQIPGQPIEKQPSQPQNQKIDYPEMNLPCKIQVISQGIVQKEISIIKTKSLLIGRFSKSMETVDLDLAEYTNNIDKISRNHLKIWYSEPYLMMKNIGSHRVMFNGMEMFPDDQAYLSENVIIKIADLELKVMKG